MTDDETTALEPDPSAPDPTMLNAAAVGPWPSEWHRPRPTMSSSMVFGGAVLAIFGLYVAIAGQVLSDSGDDPVRKTRIVMGVVGALFLVGGEIVGRFGPKTLIIVSTLAVATGASLVLGSTFTNTLTTGVRVGFFMLLVAGVFAAFFLFSAVRGRPFVLGISLFFILGGLAVLLTSRGDLAETTSSPNEARAPSIVALALGALYLVIGHVFDRRHRPGLGTPFFAVGIVGAILGLLGLVSNLGSVWGGSVLALAVGLLLVYAGSDGDRRATAWIGIAISIVSIGTLLGQVWERPVSFGIAAAVVGAALLAAGVTMSRIESRSSVPAT